MQNITLTTPSSSISTNKSLIKFYLGLESKVQAKPVENGAIYITTDTKKMYADLLGERINLTNSVELKTLNDEEFLRYVTEGV